MNDQNPTLDPEDTFFDNLNLSNDEDNDEDDGDDDGDKKPALTESESAALAVFSGIDNEQAGGRKKRRRTRKK